jgi:5-methyltetrahydropteroyltriglutamate--homocysteine methyltransferase
MRLSTDRILVSHAGNLPRPANLSETLERHDHEAFREQLPGAVEWIVDKQIELGVDVVNDGEYPKALSTYAGYIHERVTGWETRDRDPNQPPKRAGTAERDRQLFPGFYESGLWFAGSGGPQRPGFATPGVFRQPATLAVERVCTAPITYTGHDAIKADTERFTTAVQGKDVEGYFAALGPLSLGAGARNEYYNSEEEYMIAVAEAVREEYRAIADAGFIVQVDEPEWATTWSFYPEWSVEDLRRYLAKAAEYINHSLEGIPEEQVRFHFCWGSGHRPHVTDIDLKHIADIAMKIKAQCYSIEAANVRHAHEYTVWEDVKLPEGKILMPGVISHATDLVEHPELVAERIVNFAERVGREHVQTGTDCGIGSRVGHEEIVWAKLAAMSEGARIASERLWK